MHLQFLQGMAVPTSNQQLLFSRMYHAAIARPSAFNASAFASSVAVFDARQCSHTAAREGSRGIDARVSSASRHVAGRGMTSCEGDVVRKARPARKKATLKGYLLIVNRFCQDSMTYAVSCIVTLCSNYLPNPGRSKAQRRLTIGSSRTVSQAARHRGDIPSCLSD